MKIMEAIDRADALCPNPYTLEEKLSWCDEVNAELRRGPIKSYDMIEIDIDSFGCVQIPDDLSFERIEAVFYNGVLLDKQDFRTFIRDYKDGGTAFALPKRLKAVYLTLPEKIRNTDVRGEFNTGINYIEMEMQPFEEEDRLEISELSDLSDEPDWENAAEAYVMEVQPDRIILDRDALTAQTAARLAMRRIIDDSTEIDEAPYDSMYVEYILAKIALYQHDYVGYNAHMTQYNAYFETLRREMRERSPLTDLVRFRNYTVI